MALLGGIFGAKPKQESVVLVDVGVHTVSGAYAHFVENEPPTLIFEKTIHVEFREGELQESAVFRAVKLLGDALVSEGAPVLARATGSGSVRDILVSINAPWQKTSVRSEFLEEKKPFVFTKHLVAAVLDKTKVKPPGKTLVDESIIGTILNGYETNQPYGKEAHRAEIVILTSLIDDPVAKAVMTTLRSVFHTKRILPIAGSSLRYQAMRRAFPHERDALILDVTGPLTSIALIRRDLFMSIIQIADGLPTVEAWIEQVKVELIELSRRYPLPRTIFLLAREPDIFPLQEALAASKLGELWLSENPPSVVPVLSSHLTELVHRTATGQPDLLMFFMALYWQRHLELQ